MELIVGVLFVAGVLYASKKAVEHVGAEFRKSRPGRGGPRHAMAWFTGEAIRGFPVTRAGFQSGWLAHQTAMEQYHARREEARTSHLEARASVLSELREHRRRQAEAQARIDAAGQPLLDEVARKRAAAKERLRQAREALEANGEAERKAGIDHETERYLDLNDDVIAAEQGVKDARHLPTRRPDGQPETDADRRFFDERESGYTGPLDQDGRHPAADDPAVATLQAMREPVLRRTQEEIDRDFAFGAPAVPPSPEGRQHMANATDTNYTTVLTSAKGQAEQAEYAAADIRAQRAAAEQMLEAMQAANLDAASMSDQADHVAQLRRAEEALTAVTESGGQVQSGLEQRHGGIKEAHDDAPVEAAESGFYQE